MMRRPLMLLSLVVGCTGAPGPETAATKNALSTAPPLTAAQQAAAAALRADLSAHVATLPRSIDVYHYMSRGRLGLLPSGTDFDPKAPAIKNHLRTWGAYFADPGQPITGHDTGGFYAANDPVVSSGFGDDAPVLFRVRLPAGWRYLDISHMENPPPALAGLVQAAGCDDPSYRMILTFLDSQECRALALAAVPALGVSGIGYAWGGDRFRDCPTRDNLTFILFGDGIPDANVQVFAAAIPTPDPVHDERAAINGMFLQVLDTKSAAPPWPALNGEADRAGPWMREHLLYCEGNSR
jgi:hypothetical protein